MVLPDENVTVQRNTKHRIIGAEASHDFQGPKCRWPRITRPSAIERTLQNDM